MSLTYKIYNEMMMNGYNVTFDTIDTILNHKGTKADGDVNDIIESLRMCNTKNANELIKAIA
jgi:hypothetical protein